MADLTSLTQLLNRILNPVIGARRTGFILLTFPLEDGRQVTQAANVPADAVKEVIDLTARRMGCRSVSPGARIKLL